MKRYEHRLHEARISQKRWKTAIRQMHQLGGVLIDAGGRRDWRPNLAKKVPLAGAGHWIQHERPAEVNHN